MARKGYGTTRIGQWWAVIPIGNMTMADLEGDHVWMTLETACRWLRFVGYGKPL